MEEGDDIKAAVATATTHVWQAKFILFVIKPMQWALTMAYFAACLYGGTWIVVLALRHSGALK